jgi:hypothetical protein
MSGLSHDAAPVLSRGGLPHLTTSEADAGHLIIGGFGDHPIPRERFRSMAEFGC